MHVENGNEALLLVKVHLPPSGMHLYFTSDVFIRRLLGTVSVYIFRGQLHAPFMHSRGGSQCSSFKQDSRYWPGNNQLFVLCTHMQNTCIRR